MRRFIKKLLKIRRFSGSGKYWEDRYSAGGDSGRGSYGELAKYKAEVLNRFVTSNHIQSVIEFGCGDGNQLSLATYPNYIGLDVSATAIRTCISAYKNDLSKSFFIYDSMACQDHHHIYHADTALSLDVIYHLIEDDVFHLYMKQLFSSAKRFVVIYAWDVAGADKVHVKHRKFSDWIKTHQPSWELMHWNTEVPKPKEACDFYFYQKA
jgi:hypothetical protein